MVCVCLGGVITLTNRDEQANPEQGDDDDGLGLHVVLVNQVDTRDVAKASEERDFEQEDSNANPTWHCAL